MVRDYYDKGLIGGVVDFLLLFLVSELPSHGYRMIKELAKRSRGYFRLDSGTVYPALRRLELAGLVSGQWQEKTERRQRCYSVTELGRQVLASRLSEWRSFSRIVTELLGLGSNRNNGNSHPGRP